MVESNKTKEIEKVRKELVKRLTSFRLGQTTVKKRVNVFPFLGMVIGFIFGVAYLFYFWEEVSHFVPLTLTLFHTYRFGAIGFLGFPIVTAVIGTLIGKVVELLIRKARSYF